MKIFGERDSNYAMATCGVMFNGEQRTWRMRVTPELAGDPFAEDIIKEMMTRQIQRRHPGDEVRIVGEVWLYMH